MSNLINRRDLDFLLYEFLNIEALLERPHFTEHDRENFTAVLDIAQAIAEDLFEPHASSVDANEPEFDGERVHIIAEVKTALDAYSEAGFLGAGFATELGGMQLPWVVVQSCAAIFSAANISTYSYSLLTIAAANLINEHGSEEQKALYLASMLEGRFFGTMCMSEPQAGSSLADIRTQAELITEDRYQISGTKMWISGGEHNLCENIIHLVLAKIPGGPPGVKGLSLFIVPKFLVEQDGSLGAHNNVALAGLNHKMGYRGTVNTVLNFGEQGDCIGYLVGEPHRGLSYMFRMMNEARVGIGMGATMLGYTGYLRSLEYARERPQGRHAQNRDPLSPPVMIIEHTDIRRLLLTQKSYVEGALGLCLYCALLIDEQKVVEDDDQRQRLSLLLDILTPIAKSWPSEYCLEANKHAIQVLGGYGYTRDYPLERLYRDNRLNPIHEGTHGIQGIDLLGRKVIMKDGAAFNLLMEEIGLSIQDAMTDAELRHYAQALDRVCGVIVQTTNDLTELSNLGKNSLFLANATIYLDMLGHLVLAWIWLRQALAAQRGMETAHDSDRDFYAGKLRACRFFYHYELPKVYTQAELLSSFDDTCLNMPEAAF